MLVRFPVPQGTCLCQDVQRGIVISIQYHATAGTDVGTHAQGFLAINFQRFLTALGSTYQAVQQWEEARSTLEEAVAMAKTLDFSVYYVPVLSRLCMHCAVAGEWGQAHMYAVQAIALRKSFERALILLDFSPQYETEALLRAGDERQVREAVRRLEERLGSNRRFRIPYLFAYPP